MNPAEQKPSESVTLAAKGGGRGGRQWSGWPQHPITIKNISFDTVLSVTLPREALDQDQDQVHSTQTSEEEEMGASHYIGVIRIAALKSDYQSCDVLNLL